jgi:hypothetical protein
MRPGRNRPGKQLLSGANGIKPYTRYLRALYSIENIIRTKKHHPPSFSKKISHLIKDLYQKRALPVFESSPHLSIRSGDLHNYRTPFNWLKSPPYAKNSRRCVSCRRSHIDNEHMILPLSHYVPNRRLQVNQPTLAQSAQKDRKLPPFSIPAKHSVQPPPTPIIPHIIGYQIKSFVSGFHRVRKLGKRGISPTRNRARSRAWTSNRRR